MGGALVNRDLGLLVLRLGGGTCMAFLHGLGKLQKLLSGDLSFADPIGLGAAPSLVLAVCAEFFCSLALIAGFKTRWVAIPPAFTMLVAGFVVHAADPWRRKELALVYASLFIALAFTGAGRYSLDGLWARRRGES